MSGPNLFSDSTAGHEYLNFSWHQTMGSWKETWNHGNNQLVIVGKSSPASSRPKWQYRKDQLQHKVFQNDPDMEDDPEIMGNL